MRAFALFVALLAGSLLVAAVLTYPAWWLVSLVSIEPVHRVMHRIAMLLALIGLVVLTRRLGLTDKESLGYGLPRREFLRQMGVGFVCGIGLMLPLTALLLGLDIREVKPGFDGAWLGFDRRRLAHRRDRRVHRRNILPRRVVYRYLTNVRRGGGGDCTERAVRVAALPGWEVARAAGRCVVGARLRGVEQAVRTVRGAADVRRFVRRSGYVGRAVRSRSLAHRRDRGMHWPARRRRRHSSPCCARRRS